MCAGTVDGGKRAAATNKERYGEDYFEKIGAKGGKNGHTGGFYANRELARTAGALGGRKSRRGPNKPKPVTIEKHQGILDRVKEVLHVRVH